MLFFNFFFIIIARICVYFFLSCALHWVACRAQVLYIVCIKSLLLPENDIQCLNYIHVRRTGCLPRRVFVSYINTNK